MGYIITELSEIPNERGIHHYIYLLETNWETTISQFLRQNLFQLMDEVGKSNIIVKGLRPKSFYNSVIDTYISDSRQADSLRDHTEKFPVLLITDQHPGRNNQNSEESPDLKVIIIPLGTLPEQRIISVFNEIVQLITSNADLFDKLSNVTPSNLDRIFRKLFRILDLRPNFFGFGLNLNEVIEDIWFRRNDE